MIKFGGTGRNGFHTRVGYVVNTPNQELVISTIDRHNNHSTLIGFQMLSSVVLTPIPDIAANVLSSF